MRLSLVKQISLLLGMMVISSCGMPFGSSFKNQLSFNDSVEATKQKQQSLLQEELKRKQFREEKIQVEKNLLNEAKSSFNSVKDLFDQKCMNCHDGNFKLPLYGRIFPGINPVHKHQVDGLKALDYADGFPFKAQGNPLQLALLKSIKNSFATKTMPLKSFTAIYPKKKINSEDQMRINKWIDPLIQQFEDFEVRYNSVDLDLSAKAQKVLELKCFRCHANGNDKGNFGGMESVPLLVEKNYLKPGNPEESKIYQSIRDLSMPPNKLDALTTDEIYAIRDYIDQLKLKETVKP